jgi:hypothetical protein
MATGSLIGAGYLERGRRQSAPITARWREDCPLLEQALKRTKDIPSQLDCDLARPTDLALGTAHDVDGPQRARAVAAAESRIRVVRQ